MQEGLAAAGKNGVEEDDFARQFEHDDGGDGGGGGPGFGSSLHAAFFASSPREQFLRLSPCSSLVVEPVSSSTAVTYEQTNRDRFTSASQDGLRG